jgi:hypothetical protein
MFQYISVYTIGFWQVSRGSLVDSGHAETHTHAHISGTSTDRLAQRNGNIYGMDKWLRTLAVQYIMADFICVRVN